MKLLPLLLALPLFFAVADSDGLVVCYFASWAVYRPPGGQFDVDDIDPFLCTHLMFGFAGIDPETNTIRVFDPYNELCPPDGANCAYDRFTALKKKNPDLKTILAVGGWNEKSYNYSVMASTPEFRKSFIDSSLVLLNEHNFDGLDMDWEYPVQRGGLPDDFINFPILLKEFSEALHADGKILSSAVSAGKLTIDISYDVPEIVKYVDLLSIMAYDFHGAWENFTHHNAPLYQHELDTEGNNTWLNVDYGVNYWLDAGLDPSKAVLGTALYGRCYTLDDPSVNGLYAPASEPGVAGPYTKEPGHMSYLEICEKQMAEPWTIVQGDESGLNEPYTYYGDQWCGYDDAASLHLKACYARSMGFAGVMTWEIDEDDFHPTCSGRAFDLTQSIKESFNGGDCSDLPPPLRTV